MNPHRLVIRHTRVSWRSGLRAPGGGTRIELSSFVRPDHRPGSPTAMAKELGLRNVSFEVDDVRATVDELAAHGQARALPGAFLRRLSTRDVAEVARNVMNRRSLGSPAVRDKPSPGQRKGGSGKSQD